MGHLSILAVEFKALAEMTSPNTLSIRCYKVFVPLVMPLVIPVPLITSIIFKQ